MNDDDIKEDQIIEELASGRLDDIQENTDSLEVMSHCQICDGYGTVTIPDKYGDMVEVDCQCREERPDDTDPSGDR